MFLVQYFSGSYSDYTETNVFVTADEEKAKAWIEGAKKAIEDGRKIDIPKWNFVIWRPINTESQSWKDYVEEQKAAREKRYEIMGEYRALECFCDYHDDLGFTYFPIEVR